jgi:hypothetical protein
MVFVSMNDQEFQMVYGSVFVYSYSPDSLRPSSGPSSGSTAVRVEGSGLIRQCGVGAPRIRFIGKDDSVVWSELDGRVVDTSTLGFQTPRVDRAGVVAIQISMDHQIWIPIPLQLPNDNFFFYQAQVSSVTPSLGSDLGGTLLEIAGSGFPDTGVVSVQFGDKSIVKGDWRSASSLTIATPTSLALGAYSLYISFNNNDWQPMDKSFFVYQNIPDTDLGISPVAGPRSGGTKVSLTLLDGDELSHRMLTLKFVCGDKNSVVVIDSDPVRNVVSLPGANEVKRMASYQFYAPVMPIACVAEISIARNGQDFHLTSHHFQFYNIETKDLSIAPKTLVKGQVGFEININIQSPEALFLCKKQRIILLNILLISSFFSYDPGNSSDWNWICEFGR